MTALLRIAIDSDASLDGLDTLQMAILIGATSRIRVSLATTATISERRAGLRDRNLTPFGGRFGPRKEASFVAIPR